MASKSSNKTGGTSVETIGNGGELHQVASEGQDRLTTAFGHVVGDDQNGLKAGPRGPTLLEDFVLRDKLTHFDHERIPERVARAREQRLSGLGRALQARGHLVDAQVLQVLPLERAAVARR